MTTTQRRTGATRRLPPTSQSEARPQIFLASSAEARPVLEEIATWIEEYGGEPRPWTEAFPAGEFTLSSILEAGRRVDGAVVIARADDTTTSRAKRQPSPRDNILLEIGVFVTALSPRRTAIVSVPDNRGRFPNLPSDLAGLTVILFGPGQTFSAKRELRKWFVRSFPMREGQEKKQIETRNGTPYTWADVDRGVEHIRKAVERSKFEPDVVIGMGRSGAVIGGLVATYLGSIPLRVLDLSYEERRHGLDVSVQEADGLRLPPKAQRALVVEGATIGGLTPHSVQRLLARHHPQLECQFAFLIQSAGSSFHGDYYAFREQGPLGSLPWHGGRARSFLARGGAGRSPEWPSPNPPKKRKVVSGRNKTLAYARKRLGK